MTKPKTNNYLRDWEVAIVKAMLKYANKNGQDITAYFTRPSRSIASMRVSEIKDGKIKEHQKIEPASEEAMNRFMNAYPAIDPKTGLNLHDNTLLIKAREAMLNAVQTFNNPNITFKTETFIVLAVIAWTYLLYACLKSKNIDYRKHDKESDKPKATEQDTPHDLNFNRLLRHKDLNLEEGTKENLKYLRAQRNAIEHSGEQQIDEDSDLLGYIYPCAINFNDYLKEYFGDAAGLDKSLAFAIQFSRLSADQAKQMMKNELPTHLATVQSNFESELPKEVLESERYFLKVSVGIQLLNNQKKGEKSYRLLPEGSEEAKGAEVMAFKKVNFNLWKPGEIVTQMQQKEEGYPNFTMWAHIQLMKDKLKKPAKVKGSKNEYGIWQGSTKLEWRYYDSWVEVVREHCAENQEKYVAKVAT